MRSRESVIMRDAEDYLFDINWHHCHGILEILAGESFS